MSDFYTIQQVSELTDITAHTLRYYERIDLLPPIQRGGNGHRIYTADDIGWVRFLTYLRRTGMSIQMMKRYVDLERAGENTVGERLALLNNHRCEIQEHMQTLQTFLQVLNRKIAHYEGVLDGSSPPPPCD